MRAAKATALGFLLVASCAQPPPATIPEPEPAPVSASAHPAPAEPFAEPPPNPEHRAQFDVYGLLFDVVGRPVETKEGWAVTLTIDLHNTHTGGPAQLGPDPHVLVTARLLQGERKLKLWAAGCLSPDHFDPDRLLTLAPGSGDHIGIDRSEDEVKRGQRIEGRLMTCGVRTPSLEWTSLELAAYVLEVGEDGNIAEFSVTSLVGG